MDRQTAYAMLGICQEAAPTANEQIAFAQMYRKMESDGLPNETILKQLCYSLIDGLQHGNWPIPS